MATNKIVLRTVDEVMSGYVPQYQPLYPLFLGKSQAYSEEVGKMNFHRLEAVGDLRAKHITPKDTEIREISVVDKVKSFKKYFLANRYTQSQFQAAEDIEGIVAQVLDEQQKHMDDLLLLGEGTSASTMLNNGLYWSNDPNYILNVSDEMANAPDTQNEMYDSIMSLWAQGRDLAGEKSLIVYGSTALGKLDSLIPSTVQSLRGLVEEAIGGSIVRLPSAVTPSSANGAILVNRAQVKLHYTTLPQLKAQGVNDEKMYSWHNFLMGSCMLEVLAYGGVIRQPWTFEA